jgi:hypothetical protein
MHIFVGYKREFIMTPGEYKRTMLRLLKEKEPIQRVIDLFVVPDYEEYFKACTGTFNRWAKVNIMHAVANHLRYKTNDPTTLLNLRWNGLKSK